MEILLHDGREEVLLRYKTGNFELCRMGMVTAKGGGTEQGWAPERWYATVVQALDAMMNLKVGNSNATTLKELKDLIVSFRAELTATYGDHITEEKKLTAERAKALQKEAAK